MKIFLIFEINIIYGLKVPIINIIIYLIFYIDKNPQNWNYAR